MIFIHISAIVSVIYDTIQERDGWIRQGNRLIRYGKKV